MITIGGINNACIEIDIWQIYLVREQAIGTGEDEQRRGNLLMQRQLEPLFHERLQFLPRTIRRHS